MVVWGDGSAETGFAVCVSYRPALELASVSRHRLRGYGTKTASSVNDIPILNPIEMPLACLNQPHL